MRPLERCATAGDTPAVCAHGDRPLTLALQRGARRARGDRTWQPVKNEHLVSIARKLVAALPQLTIEVAQEVIKKYVRSSSYPRASDHTPEYVYIIVSGPDDIQVGKQLPSMPAVAKKLAMVCCPPSRQPTQALVKTLSIPCTVHSLHLIPACVPRWPLCPSVRGADGRGDSAAGAWR